MRKKDENVWQLRRRFAKKIEMELVQWENELRGMLPKPIIPSDDPAYKEYLRVHRTKLSLLDYSKLRAKRQCSPKGFTGISRQIGIFIFELMKDGDVNVLVDYGGQVTRIANFRPDARLDSYAICRKHYVSDFEAKLNNVISGHHVGQKFFKLYQEWAKEQRLERNTVATEIEKGNDNNS